MNVVSRQNYFARPRMTKTNYNALRAGLRIVTRRRAGAGGKTRWYVIDPFTGVSVATGHGRNKAEALARASEARARLRKVAEEFE